MYDTARLNPSLSLPIPLYPSVDLLLLSLVSFFVLANNATNARVIRLILLQLHVGDRFS